MRSLILFTNENCLEFSMNVLPQEIPIKSAILKKLNQDTPVIAQLQIEPNILYDLGDGLTAFLTGTKSAYYSTTNISPVRIGNMEGDNIKLASSLATLSIKDNVLYVADAETVYLNGKKIECGEYDLTIGDFIWVANNRIIPHCEYIEVQGINYSSNLRCEI